MSINRPEQMFGAVSGHALFSEQHIITYYCHSILTVVKMFLLTETAYDFCIVV